MAAVCKPELPSSRLKKNVFLCCGILCLQGLNSDGCSLCRASIPHPHQITPLLCCKWLFTAVQHTFWVWIQLLLFLFTTLPCDTTHWSRVLGSLHTKSTVAAISAGFCSGVGVVHAYNWVPSSYWLLAILQSGLYSCIKLQSMELFANNYYACHVIHINHYDNHREKSLSHQIIFSLQSHLTSLVTLSFCYLGLFRPRFSSSTVNGLWLKLLLFLVCRWK